MGNAAHLQLRDSTGLSPVSLFTRRVFTPRTFCRFEAFAGLIIASDRRIVKKSRFRAAGRTTIASAGRSSVLPRISPGVVYPSSSSSSDSVDLMIFLISVNTAPETWSLYSAFLACRAICLKFNLQQIYLILYLFFFPIKLIMFTQLKHLQRKMVHE